jgi:hypothetical protein
MVQAPVLDSRFLDLLPFCQDGGAAPEADVSGCEVAEALVRAVVVVMFDKGCDGRLESALQIVVFQNEEDQGLIQWIKSPTNGS